MSSVPSTRNPLEDYSVWSRNIFNLRDNEVHERLIRFGLEPALPEWTEEFRGSRHECLRYLNMALIDISEFGHGHRNWTFAVSPPGEAPNQPLEPTVLHPS